jgi:two-component system, sensor histidine kinase RegB
MPLSSYVAPLNFSTLLPIRLFIVLRWVAIFGQVSTILAVYFGFGFDLPLKSLILILGVSIGVNLVLSYQRSIESRLTLPQISFYLIYDLGQLTAMLFITGGLNNPFCLFILAPTAIAAAILSGQTAIFLCAMALISVAILATSPYPLPWMGGGLILPEAYALGTAAALVIAILFITFYVWNIAREANQLQKALNATQLALAKEQKLSSLGALAAAAAHELGSPLSTISLASKEILSNLSKNDSLYEDASLVVSQSDRCRDILMKLSSNSTEDHQLPCRNLPLSAIIELAAQSHAVPQITLQIKKESPDPEPHLLITPELLHGLGNVLQNAYQFAQSHINVSLRWGNDTMEIMVHDNGPGYPISLLSRLGHPYVSGRSLSPNENTDKRTHLGLGLFIAQTLLSQRGGQMHFSNDAGAKCLIKWAHSTLFQ